MKRIAVWSVARPTIANHRLDLRAANYADHVILSIREIQVAIWTDGNTFGAVESRLEGIAAVPGITFVSGPGDVVDAASGQVESITSVSLAQSEIKRVSAVEVDRPGPIERSVANGRAIRSRLAPSRAAESRNRSEREIHTSQPVVADVADVKVARVVECD